MEFGVKVEGSRWEGEGEQMDETWKASRRAASRNGKK